MRRRRFWAVLMMLALIFALIGCGASYDSAATEMMTNQAVKQESALMDKVFYEEGVMEETAAGAAAPESPAPGQEQTEHVQTDRKLIKTVDMTVETKEFDQTIALLEESVAELDGYIENLETYNGSSYSGYRSTRDASMTIRIPKQRLDHFLETVEGVSNVVRRSESVEDVTLTYVDLESHKRVLQAEQERLLELIEQAEVIEDIITIENRLSDVRYQIESMEARLRTFDNKVDYSTVYLYVEEVRELTPVEEETIPEQIASGFAESLRDIGDGLVEFAVWFVVNIPYFILWIIVLAVVIVVIRLLTRVLRTSNERYKKKKGMIGKTTEPVKENGTGRTEAGTKE